MTQYARPSSDISKTNWTGVGDTTNLYANLDETSASDTDYCTTTTLNAILEVKLGSVTDPGVGTGHTVRFRAQSTGSGAGEKQSVWLYEGATLRATCIDNSPVSRGTWTDYSYDLTEAEANAITDYTDLRLRFSGTTMTTGTDTYRVSWAVLEAPDAAGIEGTANITLGDLSLSSPSPLSATAVSALNAWWEFEEASGTRYDTHATYDLTVGNDPNQVTGKHGYAAGFVAANNDYLYHNDTADLRFGDQDWAVTFWFNITSAATANPRFIQKGGATGYTEFLVVSSLSYVHTPQAHVWDGAATPSVLGIVTWPSTLAEDTWYWMCVWHDASAKTIYMQINDATPQSDTYTGTAGSNTGAFTLGRAPAANFQYNGAMDDLAFWQGAFPDADDRAALYKAGVGSTYIQAIAPTWATGKLAISATASKTLGALTLSATAENVGPNEGTADITLDALTVAGTAELDISATLNKSLGALTCAATAELDIDASLSKTLDSVTLSATATNVVAREGSANITLARLLPGTITDRIDGPLGETDPFIHEADFVLRFNVGFLPSGGLMLFRFRVQDTTNYWFITIDQNGVFLLREYVSASAYTRITTDPGTVVLYSSIVVTANDETITLYVNNVNVGSYGSASNFKTETSGQVSGLGVFGSANNLVTQPISNYAALGELDIDATLSKTLDSLTASGTATLDISAILSKTLDALTLVSTASLDITATLSKTLDVLTLAATGTILTTGSLAKTLDALTASATGELDITATLTKTLDALTLSSVGKLDIAATLSATLDVLTASGTAELDIAATLAKTLDALTLAAVGNIEGGISGSADITLDPLTAAGVGALDIEGQLSNTLDALIAAGVGELDIAATLAKILDALTLAATGTSSATGSLSVTLDALTAVGTGELDIKATANVTLASLIVTSTSELDISATASITLAELTLSATGELDIIAALAKTLDSLTLAATGSTGATGQADITLDPLTAAGTAELDISGTLTKILETLTLVASGNLDISATLSKTLDALISSGVGELDIEGQANVTLGELALSATGTKQIISTGALSKTLGELTCSASGKLYIDSALDVVLDPLTSAATGELDISASAAITLEQLEISATGSIIITGATTVTLAILALSATGLHTGEETPISSIIKGPSGFGTVKSSSGTSIVK